MNHYQNRVVTNQIGKKVMIMLKLTQTFHKLNLKH